MVLEQNLFEQARQSRWGRAQPWVKVAETRNGRGVIANAQFQPTETVGQIHGEVIDDPDYGSDYAIDLGPGLSLEPGPPFRFLNHSCDPNCSLVIHEEEDDDEVIVSRRAMLEALRPIESGEELTIDYGWDAESAIPCGCESPKCREWVVAEEELPRFHASEKRARKGLGRSRRGSTSKK